MLSIARCWVIVGLHTVGIRYNKTQSGRYQRVVVDLAEVAGQKFAAGLITQEQFDQILDDLESGKTVVGDVF